MASNSLGLILRALRLETLYYVDSTLAEVSHTQARWGQAPSSDIREARAEVQAEIKRRAQDVEEARYYG